MRPTAKQAEMPEGSPALVICAEPEFREKIAAMILRYGLRPACCTTMTSARSLLAQQKFGVVLCGEFLPDGDFRAVLEEIAHSGLDVPVIVLSRLDDWGAYLNAIRAGAFDYIACPPDCAEAGRILCLALEKSSGRYRVAHPAA